MESIINICKAKQEEVAALRRELHKVPEIGGELPKTREIVCSYLDKIGVAYKINEMDDGIIADIKCSDSGKILGFRADMDGLHITENTQLPYKSVIDGQMHGCGHDAHTAILLVAADIINKHKSEFNGTVRLIFQTGEETGTGAKNMISSGVLENLDAVCAVHVGNIAGDEFNTGDLIVLSGPVSAGKIKFTITVKGKGTHTAFPEKGVDPILIAARIANACEEIFAREIPIGTAAILSFGSFHAGIDHNTIPETAVLKGCIRAQDEKMRINIAQRMKDIAENISKAFRAECCVDIIMGSQTVMNDANLSELVADASTELFGEEVVTKIDHPLMGSDDFANYASRIPGAYFILHTNNPQKNITAPNHNDRFDVDESVLWKGVAAYVGIAKKFLV